MRAEKKIFFSFSALILACGPGAEPDPAQPLPPIARFQLPRAGAPGAQLPADGTRSQSPGGALTHWRFSFGDGSAQVDSGIPRLQHAWTSAGTYTVSLEVQDAQGRTALAQGQIQVRQNPPACSTDANCTAPDVCIQTRCTATWGSP